MSENDYTEFFSSYDENSFYIDEEQLNSDSDTICNSFFLPENDLIEFESELAEEKQSDMEQKESIIGKKVQIQLVQKNKGNDERPSSKSVSQPVKVSPKYFISQPELQQNFTCKIRLFLYYSVHTIVFLIKS